MAERRWAVREAVADPAIREDLEKGRIISEGNRIHSEACRRTLEACRSHPMIRRKTDRRVGNKNRDVLVGL